jgi:hypothetical protein
MVTKRPPNRLSINDLIATQRFLQKVALPNLQPTFKADEDAYAYYSRLTNRVLRRIINKLNEQAGSPTSLIRFARGIPQQQIQQAVFQVLERRFASANTDPLVNVANLAMTSTSRRLNGTREALTPQESDLLTSFVKTHALNIAKLLSEQMEIAASSRDSIQTHARELHQAITSYEDKLLHRVETWLLTTAIESAKASTNLKRRWVTAKSPTVCKICSLNAAEGVINPGEVFRSGHEAPPAHPFCRCQLGLVSP